VTADYDVVVAGGGPGGTAAAITLTRGGLKVILIETRSAQEWKIGETLVPESRQILQNLGVWESFVNDGHLPCYGNCSAWGTDQMLEKDFIFNPWGCGWQLDRARFEMMLLRASEKEGAVILRGETVQDFKWWEGRWEIDLRERTVRSPWLIDATGRRAMVARQMGKSRLILDQLISIYVTATSDTGADRDSRTFIESRPEGWWYIALMPNRRRTVGFQTDADLIRDQDWRDPAWLQKRFCETRHLAVLLETQGYRFDAPAQITSAHSGRLEQCFGEGWLAVGDAAQSFDPLSGQGIFNALITGQKAAEALLQDWPEANAGVMEYGTSMEDRWAQFLQNRQQNYLMEQTWKQLPFWLRRR